MNFIIKLFILLTLSYLFIEYNSCEHLSNVETYNKQKPVSLALSEGANKYTFITFNQLKDTYKSSMLTQLLTTTFMNNENLVNIKLYKFKKTPILLINSSDLSKYTNLTKSNITFQLVKNKTFYGMTPIINDKKQNDQYLYSDTTLGIMYYSKYGNKKDLVKITDPLNTYFIKKTNNTNIISQYLSSSGTKISITIQNK
jgi:hypothetical protein